MNVTQTSLEGGVRPLSNSGTRLLKAHLQVAMLLFAVIVSGAAVALADCYDNCQQGIALCLQLAHGDPVQEARCQVQYDKCTEDCM